MKSKNTNTSLARLALAAFIVITVGRLYYLQISRHQYYVDIVENRQTKKFTIAPERGELYFYDGRYDEVYPAVVNEARYLLFADPTYVSDPDGVRRALLDQLPTLQSGQVEEALSRPETQYVVLDRDVDATTAQRIRDLKLKGVGLTRSHTRAYIEGGLGKQVIGFVNRENRGQYGIEGYLDSQIGGQPGQYRSLVDASGLPITYGEDNILLDVIDGESLVLSLDRSLQQYGEDLTARVVADYGADQASLLVMDADSGEIIMMANDATYDIKELETIEDFTIFQTPASFDSYEPGSVIKPLTMALGLDKGVVDPDSRFFNPGTYRVDGSTIGNVFEGFNGGQPSMQQVLSYSLNTGTIHVLEALDEGQITDDGKQQLYDFFRALGFGTASGVEQVGEAAGQIRSPKEERFGGDLRYANMTFGQGFSATQVQVSAAYAAIVNGGNLFQPTLIRGKYSNDSDQFTRSDKSPVRTGLVSEDTSRKVTSMLQQVVADNAGTERLHEILPTVGGKTGTAQVANPSGGYYNDRFIGSYMGVIEGEGRRLIVSVRIDNPQVEFAGGGAAAPIFVETAEKLIQYYGLGI